jgi:hypothetical protein
MNCYGDRCRFQAGIIRCELQYFASHRGQMAIWGMPYDLPFVPVKGMEFEIETDDGPKIFIVSDSKYLLQKSQFIVYLNPPDIPRSYGNPVRKKEKPQKKTKL